MVYDMAYTNVGCVNFIVVSCVKFSILQFSIMQFYLCILPLGGAVIFYSRLCLINKIPF